jgi:protein-tyrosine phosphatase
MGTQAYWIEGPWPGRLAILPRPRGGDWLADELRSWQKLGINAVVSALESSENEELELGREAQLCRDMGLTFVPFSIPDRGVPSSLSATHDFARHWESELASGTNIGVHCRQGIGRSSLLVASMLLTAGIDPAIAFKRIQAARGVPVPDTKEQRDWVERLFKNIPTAPLR